MATKYKVKNGPATLELEEVVIGSELRIGLYVEMETAPGSGIFVPFDFTLAEYAAHLKLTPKNDVDPLLEFVCTPRLTAGWIDLYLGGDKTGTLVEKIYQGSLKVWPIGDDTEGITLVVITVPAKYRATR